MLRHDGVGLPIHHLALGSKGFLPGSVQTGALCYCLAMVRGPGLASAARRGEGWNMRLLRSEIYLLVWSMPMTAVGRLLGISSGSLGKTCERRGIPTPARGYWQKIGAGHEPPVPPEFDTKVT